MHAISRTLAALGSSLAALAALAAPASGQAAVDPNVPPQAAALERQGERALATELLGRYLAVAPDDGRAWLQLGRFYLLDARDWHARGHRGEPSGALYLDFAGTAFDQSIRLQVDSGLVLRRLVALERSLLVIEDSGWSAAAAAARTRSSSREVPPLPAFIAELGANILGSCPTGGVLLTGGDFETLAVWYDALELGRRDDVLPLRPGLYATDSVYRARMALALEVDAGLPVQQALRRVAERRAVCLSPGADSAALPNVRWTSVRLVRVSRPGLVAGGGVVSITEFLRTASQDGSVWLADVRAVYALAARHNPLLCQGLFAPLRDLAPGVCGP